VKFPSTRPQFTPPAKRKPNASTSTSKLPDHRRDRARRGKVPLEMIATDKQPHGTLTGRLIRSTDGLFSPMQLWHLTNRCLSAKHVRNWRFTDIGRQFDDHRRPGESRLGATVFAVTQIDAPAPVASATFGGRTAEAPHFRSHATKPAYRARRPQNFFAGGTAVRPSIRAARPKAGARAARGERRSSLPCPGLVSVKRGGNACYSLLSWPRASTLWLASLQGGGAPFIGLGGGKAGARLAFALCEVR